MAFEIISEIVEAEKKADQMKADAIKRAEEIQKEAYSKAKEIELEAEEKAAADKAALIKNAVESSGKQVSEIISAAEAEAEKIGENVQTLKPRAVESVIRKVVGDNVNS